jgi:protein TonB
MPYPDYDYRKYLSENLHYPDSANVHNIEGRVIVKFVVNEDGHISECEVTKPVNNYLDEEALRIIGKMPPWKPGKDKGKPVRVYFTAPIVFKLTN